MAYSLQTIEIMSIALILYSIFSIPFIFFYLEKEHRNQLRAGEKLINWMTCWTSNRDFFSFSKGKEETGEGYKFYTGLVNEILLYNRELGGYSKKNFQVVKKALLGDIRFEKKVEKEMRGSFFQYVCLGLVTWFFIGGSHQILGEKISISLKKLLLILCFQMAGVLLYQVVCRRVKKKDFYFFNLYYGPLFRFFILIHLNLPVGVVLEKSGFEVFYKERPLSWKPVLEDLRSLINKWKNQGGEVRSELDDIVEEVYFLRDLSFEKYKEKIQFLRLIFLGIFFLGPYLFYLSALLSSFLIV